ncbi:hypothetical protein ABIC01_005611 [Bradyrhizobium sp. RT4b]
MDKSDDRDLGNNHRLYCLQDEARCGQATDTVGSIAPYEAVASFDFLWCLLTLIPFTSLDLLRIENSNLREQSLRTPQMAKHEAEGDSTRLLDLTRVLLITAAGTRAGISDRVQHLHQFSDSFVLRRYWADLAGRSRWRACGAARSCVQPCSSHPRMAPAFRSTEIAQPLSVPITGSLSSNISTVIAPRDLSAPLRPAKAWSTTPKLIHTPSINTLKYDRE